MAGLFGALWLALWGVSEVKDSIERSESLSKPSYTAPETGQPVYQDNHMRKYRKNGEKLEPRYLHNPDGSLRIQMVGKRTGIVYEDDYLKKIKRMESLDDDKLKRAKEFGDLAYLKFDARHERSLTTEISTGKIIAALYNSPSKGIFRKFYLKSMPVSKYSSTESDLGDFGVPITYWEYKSLNIIGGTHTGLPKTYESIGKEADPYFGVEDKYLFDKVNGESRVGEKCEIYIYEGSHMYRGKFYNNERYAKGIVQNAKDYKFTVKLENGGICTVKPSCIRFLGKDEGKTIKCIITDNGIEKNGTVKKIEDGKYLVEFKDGSTRYIDGRSGNIKFVD